MYAKGMTMRQVSSAYEDIYGFEVSEEFISNVTVKIMPQIGECGTAPACSISYSIYRR